MALEAKLRTFLDDKGIPYHTTRRSYVMDCVNPGCRKDGHLYVHQSDGYAKCFKCSMKWSWRRLVAAIAGCPVSQAYSILFGVAAGDILDQGLDPNLFSPVESEQERIQDVRVQLGPDFVSVEKSSEALAYLESRGITSPNLIIGYDLRYHFMMHAVVFPITKDGVTYGWQARKIAPMDGELRLISHSFNKSRFLLNYDRARSHNQMILVEGPFDCLHVDLPGIGAVASLGKGVSLDQIALIMESEAKEIYLGLDPDAADEVHEIAARFGFNKRVYRITPPVHRKDFGETPVEEVQSCLQQALPISGPSGLLEVFFK